MTEKEALAVCVAVNGCTSRSECSHTHTEIHNTVSQSQIENGIE